MTARENSARLGLGLNLIIASQRHPLDIRADIGQLAPTDRPLAHALQRNVRVRVGAADLDNDFPLGKGGKCTQTSSREWRRIRSSSGSSRARCDAAQVRVAQKSRH